NMNNPDAEQVKRYRVIKDQSEVILDYYACHGKNWLGCMLDTMVGVIKANVDKRNSYQYRKEVMATFKAYIDSPEFDGVAERDQAFSACLAFAKVFCAYVEEMNSRTMEGNSILFQEATEESLAPPIDDTRNGLAMESRKRFAAGPDFEPLPVRRPITVTAPTTHLIKELPERRKGALKLMVMPLNPREQKPHLPAVQLPSAGEDGRTAASAARASRESSTFTPPETTPMPVTPVKESKGRRSGGEAGKTGQKSRSGCATRSSTKSSRKKAKGGEDRDKARKTEEEEGEERVMKRARRPVFGLMGNRIGGGADSSMDSPLLDSTMGSASAEEDVVPLKKKSSPGVVLNEFGLEEESMDERDVEEEIAGSDTSLAEWTGPDAFEEVKCFLCERVCPTYKCLSNHLYHAHKGISTDNYIFQCRGCEREFRSYRGALGHIKVAIRKRETQCKGTLAYLGEEMMKEERPGHDMQLKVKMEEEDEDGPMS
ncbi:hypothetical protein PENTCL1PPCAC_13936, partial [Pristionchus entomophagus]